MNWNKKTEKIFQDMLTKIPVFLRAIAQDKVGKRAERIATEGGRTEVSEKDMVDAFFAETPFGFHGPMKTDMESLGIDYIKHGYDK